MNLIVHCRRSESRGHTPSDFPNATLSRDALKWLIAALYLGPDDAGRIEAIYPLPASQQGMHFESVAAPDSGVHIEKTVWRLLGARTPTR